MKKVMIDSGHFKGNSNRGQTGYYEHEGVWKISNYLKQILESNSVKVDFTKPYEEDLDLYKRGQKAQDYDLFISEHTNAYNQKTIGVEVFYDFSKPQDKVYADELALAVSKIMNNPNRGAKTRTYVDGGKTLNYYGVIRGASATNCHHILLIESGYHDNLVDEAFLKIDSNLKKIAQAQANVILKILGIEVKEMTFDEAKKTIQDKAELDNNAMQYLEFYKNSEDLIKKLAVSMVDNVVVEKPIEEPKIEEKVIYTVTPNKTHQLIGSKEEFGVKIVNKSNKTIKEPNCSNGSFFWYLDTGKTQTYSTSILIKDGVIIQDVANHYYNFGCPQNVFIIYKNGNIEMKKIFFAHKELDYKNIQFAIGGVGLRDITNPNFKYDPASEGFKKDINKVTGKAEDQSGVLRQTNKTVLGYNSKLDKVIIMVRPNIYHSHALYYDLLDLVKDCGFDIALSCDGGGSVFLNNSTDMVVYGDGRKIHNLIGWF